MDSRHMLVVCGIPDLNNPSVNLLIQLFINTQGFMGIKNFFMLYIKDAPHMINK